MTFIREYSAAAAWDLLPSYRQGEMQFSTIFIDAFYKILSMGSTVLGDKSLFWIANAALYLARNAGSRKSLRDKVDWCIVYADAWEVINACNHNTDEENKFAKFIRTEGDNAVDNFVGMFISQREDFLVGLAKAREKGSPGLVHNKKEMDNCKEEPEYREEAESREAAEGIHKLKKHIYSDDFKISPKFFAAVLWGCYISKSGVPASAEEYKEFYQEFCAYCDGCDGEEKSLLEMVAEYVISHPVSKIEDTPSSRCITPAFLGFPSYSSPTIKDDGKKSNGIYFIVGGFVLILLGAILLAVIAAFGGLSAFAMGVDLSVEIIKYLILPIFSTLTAAGILSVFVGTLLNKTIPMSDVGKREEKSISTSNYVLPDRQVSLVSDSGSKPRKLVGSISFNGPFIMFRKPAGQLVQQTDLTSRSVDYHK